MATATACVHSRLARVLVLVVLSSECWQNEAAGVSAGRQGFKEGSGAVSCTAVCSPARLGRCVKARGIQIV